MTMTDSFMVKTVEGDTDLELEAESGESLSILDIQVYNPVADYATARVEKTVAGYFRVGGTLGNHLAVPPVDTYKITLLRLLREMGLWRPIPVADGEKFSVSGVAQANAIQQIIYEKHETGDLLSTMPNGSKALSYDYLNYGRLTAFLDGDNKYDFQQSPIEFPNFPYTDVVPSKSMITVFGLLFSDIGKDTATGTNVQVSKYLKLVKERETLFDEVRKGIPVIAPTPANDSVEIGEGQAFFGNYDDVDYRGPLIFPEPLVFVGGEELSIYLTTELLAGVVNLTAVETELALISRLDPLGV